MTRLFLVSYRTLALLGGLGFLVSTVTLAIAGVLWRMDYTYRLESKGHR